MPEAASSSNGDAARAVVLVEGVSDRAALEVLAVRRGMDLAADGIAIVPMAGITNIGHFLADYCVPGRGVRVTGLYDDAEERFVRRGLRRVGLGGELDGRPREALEELGFYACSPDLEDELIRALDVGVVLEIFKAEGELGSFRTFQRQPAHQRSSTQAQLHRFLGTRSGRKIRYGRLLVEALDLTRVPRPLDQALAHVTQLG